jgi:hypothetical protein
MQNEPEKSSWGFVKKVAIVVGIFSAAVVIVFTIIGYIDAQYKRGVEVGVLDERLRNSEDTRAKQEKAIEVERSTNDSLRKELALYRSTLDSVLDSKIVVSDTIIYEQDAIALFGGQVTIQCDAVDTTTRNARISGRIYEGGEPKFFGLSGMVGYQTPFDFAGSKYLLVVLGCRCYERGPGVKIAVYKR